MAGVRLLASIALCMTAVFSQHHQSLPTRHSNISSKPNVLVIMTDDQGRSTMTRVHNSI